MTGTLVRFSFAWGMGLLVLRGALAQAPADIGRHLAEQSCSACHAVGASGDSSLSGAPPFRDFARKWPLDQLEEALAEGIVTGHADMPAFKFASEDIAALIAYLDDIAE